MSKLEELINELCPNGVEYKAVEDVATITRGRVISKDYINNNQGNFPVYSSQTENNGELGYISTYDFDGEYLTWTTDGANAGSVFYRTGKFSITNVCGLIKISDTNILTRFLYFVLYVEAKKHVNYGMGNPKLMSNVMAKIKVPLPPLPVQEEIVRILDKFTELTAELTAGLTARKQQYEYYKNKLLTFEHDSVGWYELNDVIISLNTGLNPRKFFRLNTEDAINYYVTIREIRGGRFVPTDKTDRINDEALALCNNRSNLEIGDVLFSGTGTIGETAVIVEHPQNWNIKEGVYAIKPNKKRISPKFLRYLLTATYIKTAYMKKVAGGTVKSIPMGELRKLEIPIPYPEDKEKSLAEQQRIVDILDRFNKLCNDISEGLPAEIEARQKQYEYYRDKLLTFKKKEAAENE